ncbi:uncharacterized protein EV154DRAFT_476957 [Mucor mucedo]|uniref:uncharacterized protein n=1 Tax=Mucor mucedo TaxID=29922 RepID=UPI00221F479C|nr:uncharacterized protein EV154DRAFT_476957 [Mucor mucedo]KAI7895861.1 hypothetical protein EV154DRAFT_476957 [Mucor mucedo]
MCHALSVIECIQRTFLMLLNVNKHTMYNRKITEQRERYGGTSRLENERREEARRRLMRKFREDNLTSNEVEDDGHDEEKRAIRRPRKRKECEKEEVEERLNDEVQRASKIGKKAKKYMVMAADYDYNFDVVDTPIL